MTTLFGTSDMHAGSGLADDDFLSELQAFELAGKCRFLGARHVSVGDMFELQESLRQIAWRNWRSALDVIFWAHPGIRELWPYTDFVCLGNHEAPIPAGSVYKGVEFVPYAVVNGVYFTHGHQFDPIISRWPRTCGSLAQLQGWFERHVDGDFDVYVSKVRQWISGTGRYGENVAYSRPIAYAALDHDCRTAVWGHTHEYMDWGGYRCGVRIANTGHWTNGNHDVVRMEV